jgi:hypothetical protein
MISNIPRIGRPIQLPERWPARARGTRHPPLCQQTEFMMLSGNESVLGPLPQHTRYVHSGVFSIYVIAAKAEEWS